MALGLCQPQNQIDVAALPDSDNFVQPSFLTFPAGAIERRKPDHPISLMDRKLTPAGPRSESRESYRSVFRERVRAAFRRPG